MYSANTNGQKTIFLYSCGGAANVGQIANAAASTLASRTKAIHKSLAKLAAQEEMVDTDNEQYIVTAIDGCDRQCAKKILAAHNVKIDNHLVITDLGIDKTEIAQHGAAEIQLAMDAIQACSTPTASDNMTLAMSKAKCPCFS